MMALDYSDIGDKVRDIKRRLPLTFKSPMFLKVDMNHD
jgi:hypothetical protein